MFGMPLDGTDASVLPGSSSRQRYIQSNIALSLTEKRWTRAGDWSSSLPNATNVMAVNLARRARLHFDEGAQADWNGWEVRT